MAWGELLSIYMCILTHTGIVPIEITLVHRVYVELRGTWTLFCGYLRAQYALKQTFFSSAFYFAMRKCEDVDIEDQMIHHFLPLKPKIKKNIIFAVYNQK